MRAPFALAIVSLVIGLTATGSFAEGPVLIDKWATVYDAGLAASQRHNYEESLSLFERSWETARTTEQRGAAASGLGVTYRRLDRANGSRRVAGARPGGVQRRFAPGFQARRHDFGSG